MNTYKLNKHHMNYGYEPCAQLSPVQAKLKELPRGNGEWAGFSHVYDNINKACFVMANNPYVYLSEEHVNTMAVLGCGHEETMKYEQMRLRSRGFINSTDEA